MYIVLRRVGDRLVQGPRRIPRVFLRLQFFLRVIVGYYLQTM